MSEKVTPTTAALERAAGYNVLDYSSLSEASHAYSPIRKAAKDALLEADRLSHTKERGE